MANKAPPYPKQKLTDAKFREILPLLSLFENLKIEYLSKGVWFKMISKRGNSYNCECCGVENLGPTPIVDHVRGKKHRAALQNAEKLFHPNYTAPRNPNVAARTPLLDALNGNAGGGTPAKLAKSIPTKVSAGVQKPAGQQKPGPAHTKLQQSQQKAPAKKVPAAAANSETDKNTKADDSQAETKPVENDAASNQSAQSNQSQAPLQNQSNEPPKTSGQENTNDPEQQKTNDEEQEEVSQQSSNGNNNNKENKEVEKEDQKKAQTESTVDDEDDVIIISDNLDEIKSTPKNTVTMEKPIPVINSGAPKPQRPKKNNAKPNQTAIPTIQQKTATEPKKANNTPTTAEIKKNETTPTPSKKVINPAAVLAKSAEKNDENTPRYEQNRVIIPTIDKTRRKPPAEITAPKRTALPSFSTKTFSTDANEEIDGIIGVEYVVKILKVYNDPEPFYECCLCEVVMDGIGMQTHLLGYNHRYKYVEKHFPTCFNQYKEHIGNIQVMGIILDRIAKAIESHHGRELPYECLSGEFRSNRHGVMTTVYSFRHASEYSGPSFTNVVDAKQVEEFYKKKNIYQPPKPDPKRKPTFDTRNVGPSPKRNRIEPPINARGGKRGGIRGNAGPPRRPYREEVETSTIDDAVHKQMVEEFLQNTRERSRSPGGHRRRHKSRSRSRSPHRLMHKRSQRRSPSPLREGDVWQAYRHLVDRSKVELDEMYKEYRRDPEKHPMYDEEWRKFWKHRKDEIAREGLDYRNYDFQPEWVRFFAVRIEELYDEGLENIKINSRQRLILPMTNDELEDKRYHIKVPEIEQMVEIHKPKEVQQPSEVQRKMSVVHVLRLLTALEDYLGSLGPRVVDLLSKALLVEKSNPKDVDEIVLTLENCTILETAMEKLKGVLIAGLLEGPKIRAFNNVITETEKILRYAFKIRELNPQPVPQPVPAPKSNYDHPPQKQSFSGGSFSSPHQSNSMGNGNNGAAANLLSQIDKKELATKLAAALTAQGKTDFNPEQLQQLIAVYSLIDKKKRDSAAADKQKMTLSDTLTALLNPKDNVGGSGGMSGTLNQSSGRNVGGYSSNSSDRPGALSNSSINNFVSMLNRDNVSAGGSAKSGDSQMWQNLQNIQNSLRMQNSGTGSANSGGYKSSTDMGEGREGRSNYMGDMSSGSTFNRSGFGGTSGSGSGTGSGMGRSEFNLGQSSSLGFSRGGGGGGMGNASSNKESSGFYGNFQGMNSSNSSFSRSGNSMPESGRGFGGNSSSFTGDNSYSRGGGTGLSEFSTGGGNSSRYSRAADDKFLGSSGNGAGSGGSGFSSNFISGGFSSSGGFGSSSYQRGGSGVGSSGMGLGSTSTSGLGMSGGGNSGLGMGSGVSGQGGSSFNRGGGGGPSPGFGSLMSSSGNFTKNPGRNESGGNQQFNSNPRGGNIGGISMGRSSFGGGGGNMSMGNSSNSQNSGGSRGGSNWRNQ